MVHYYNYHQGNGMGLYETNLEALIEQNIQLGTNLFSLSTNEKFDVYIDEKDPFNINIAHRESAQVMYETVPLQETLNAVDQFEERYRRYPYIYFYGFGNGVFYKLLLQNDLHSRIVVIEPELEILYIVLNCISFDEEIRSGRLILAWGNQMGFPLAADLFNDPQSKIYAKLFNLHVFNSFYERNYSKTILETNNIFIKAVEHSVTAMGNDSIDALIGLEHHLMNVEKMVETPTLEDFFSKAKTTNTAIIVSTGPSLAKQLPLLKEIQNHVTIFSVDASFPILIKHGIKPDVVVAIERVAATGRFFAEVAESDQEDVVFCVTSIVHPYLLKNIKAGTLQISMRPFGYTRYFDLPDYGYAGIGMSAANMAFELVFHSKFETCILIGQDLAYGEDGKTHSEGHVFGEKESEEKESDVDALAYGGEGIVRTRKIWSLFRNFFEADIHYAQNNGMRTINATEGGARIHGAEEIMFSEVIQKNINQTQVKNIIELQYPDHNEITLNKEKIALKKEAMIAYVKKIQNEVNTLFLDVIHTAEQLNVIDAFENHNKVDFQALSTLMERIDTVKNYFAEPMFVDIFLDAVQAVIMHEEMELAKLEVWEPKTDEDRRNKMISWVKMHGSWLFSLAGIIEAVVDTFKMSVEKTIDISSIQIIRIFLDEKEIDFISVDHQSPLIKNLADIKNLCLEYQLDKKYQQNDQEFKFFYSDLNNSFSEEVHIPSVSNKNLIKFSFLNSLGMTKDPQKFQKQFEAEKACINIGLLPFSESNRNAKFIDLIKQIYHSFKEVHFLFVCFRDEEIEMMKYLFPVETDRIIFIEPTDIYALYDQIEMFIYDFEPLEDKRFYGVRNILNRTNEVEVPQLQYEKFNDQDYSAIDGVNNILFNLCMKFMGNFRIDVYLGNEKIDAILTDNKTINSMYDVKQLCYDYDLNGNLMERSEDLRFIYIDMDKNIEVEVNLPKRNHEHYNEIAFQNSLEATIDQEKFKNLYEEHAIGFLGVEENLKNDSFMQYIEKLLYFEPKIIVNIFYFDDYITEYKFNISFEQIHFIKLNSIEVLCNHTQIFIWNGLPIESEIITKLKVSNRIVGFYIYDKKTLLKTIGELDYEIKSAGHCLHNHINDFHFDKESLIQYGDSYHGLIMHANMKQFGVDFDFKTTDFVGDFYSKHFKCLVYSQDYRDAILNFYKICWKL